MATRAPKSTSRPQGGTYGRPRAGGVGQRSPGGGAGRGGRKPHRHVARLVDAGVPAVVAERRVRGALERTYVLRVAAATVGLDEISAMSADDHRQAFMAFVAGLLGDFDRYLARGEIDFLRDGVGYRMTALWLDDDEHREMLRELPGCSSRARRTRRGPAASAASSAMSARHEAAE
jgi:hypothetical protein